MFSFSKCSIRLPILFYASVKSRGCIVANMWPVYNNCYSRFLFSASYFVGGASKLDCNFTKPESCGGWEGLTRTTSVEQPAPPLFDYRWDGMYVRHVLSIPQVWKYRHSIGILVRSCWHFEFVIANIWTWTDRLEAVSFQSVPRYLRKYNL
jgi:hypothetical protein